MRLCTMPTYRTPTSVQQKSHALRPLATAPISRSRWLVSSGTCGYSRNTRKAASRSRAYGAAWVKGLEGSNTCSRRVRANQAKNVSTIGLANSPRYASCSAGESTCVRSLASWPYSAPMQPGAIGQGHFHLPAPPMLRSRQHLNKLSLPPLCFRVPPMPGLETAQRQLLPDATLGDSQATLSKALTNRAPLGGAAPYFPIGCDSRPFLLTI